MSERGVGVLHCSLCQMAVVRASSAAVIRTTSPSGVRPRWCSVSRWVFRVALTDSMICRRGLK